MTVKVIAGIIRSKINSWLATLPTDLQEQAKNKIIVSGGCIASLLSGEKVNDYDVYCKDKAVLILLMKHYLERFAENPPPRFRNGEVVKMFVDEKRKPYPRCIIKSQGIAGEVEDPEKLGYQYFETRPSDEAGEFVSKVTESLKTELMDLAEDNTIESEEPVHLNLVKEAVAEETAPKTTGPGAVEKNKYRPIFISTNAITLSDSIQLVTRFFGTPEEVHANFDFVHCTQYYDHADGSLHLNEEAMASLITRELKYRGSLYPLCSIIRLRKFRARGWNYNAGQVLKMVFQCHDLDLYNIDVLEEQLVGVDAAYFMQVVEILRGGISEGKKLDQTYICEVIDKLF